MTGVSDAVRRNMPGASTKPKPYGLLRLNKKKKFPPSAIPKVRAARRADRLGGKSLRDLTARCAPDNVDFGTWCLMNAPYGVTNREVGRNNYFFATQKCVDLGGYLPTAGQLVGAAPRIKLASTIDDSQLTASIDLDRTDGLKDRREMSSTLVTIAAGVVRGRLPGSQRGIARRPPRGRAGPGAAPGEPEPGDAAVRDGLRQPRQGRLRGQQAGQPAGAVPLRVRKEAGRGNRGSRLSRSRPPTLPPHQPDQAN